MCQKPPSDYVSKIVSFIVYVRSKQLKFGFKPENIVAMDETAIWPDSPGNSTIEFVGVKQVPIKSTGHERFRITMALSAKADGTKLKVFTAAYSIMSFIVLSF